MTDKTSINVYLNRLREVAEKHKTPEAIYKVYCGAVSILDLKAAIYPEQQEQIDDEKKQIEALMDEYRKMYDFTKVK